MTKTPEEMYYEWRQAFDESLDERMCQGETIGHQLLHRELGKETFLAGYQAAKDEELAKDKSMADAWKQNVDKMLPSVHTVVLFPSQSTKASDSDVVAKMDAAIKKAKNELADSCEHILDMEKMVDVNSSSGWISVKDRLPEEDEKVKILINYFFEGTEVREVAKAAFRNGLWSGDKVYITHPLVSHWMPLPKAPKEEK